ncbi:MAG: histidine phosphatase family protein [Pseudomonadota bacterium]
MTTLYWVRHGPTHVKSMIGWTDKPADLSDTDRIARLSAFLPADAPIVSSDLKRAVDTASALETPTRPRRGHIRDLREIHFGDWEDQTFAEVSAHSPDAIAAFWQKPGETCAPGGESWNDLDARVSAAADGLVREGQDLIVVAHFGAILTQVQRARGQGPLEVFSQQIEPLSVSVLTWNGEKWSDGLVNHCP